MINLIAATWQDESVKKRFIDEPKQVLKEYGIETGEDMELVVLEDTKDKTHIVLPEPPTDDAVVDKLLESVSGGSAPDLQELARQFTGLPMADLIGGPLSAAVKAARKLVIPS